MGMGTKALMSQPLRIWILIALTGVVATSPTVALGNDCIDYSTYFRWLGKEHTDGSATGLAVAGDYAYLTVYDD
jgi:hypothetical protein